MDEEGEFRKRWGWKITIDALSGGNYLIEKEIYTWSYIRFLNELAFKKEKGHIDKLRYERAKANRSSL